MNKRILPVLASLLLLPIAGFAQNSMIKGKVRGDDGNGVNNAAVELRGATGAVISQSFSRNEGDFSFSGLRPGEYEVYVTLSGYEPGVQMVSLRDSMRISAPTDVISEVVSVEVVLHRKVEPSPGPPGTNFVQDVPKPAREAYAKGAAKIRDGKSDEGIALLREAISEFNDYFDAHLALGFEFYRLGKDNDALESLERARQINDKGAVVYYTFGMVMVRQQKFRAAEYAFGKSAELNESHVNSHFNHAVALIEIAVRTKEQNDKTPFLAKADQELDRSWELSGKRLNTVYLQRARVHEERGDREAAAQQLEKYLKAEPEAKNAAAVKAAIAKLREKK